MGKRQERKLHESTSRAFCQLAFLLLALAPLILSIVFCLAQRFSFYHHYVNSYFEQAVASSLGLEVKIARVVPRTPNVSTMYGVRLCNPETDAEIFSASELRVERYRGQCLVEIGEAELNAAELASAWSHINKFLLERSPEDETVTHASVGELVVHSEFHNLGFRNIDLKLLPDLKDDETLLGISGFLDQHPGTSEVADEPLRMVVKRKHASDVLSTSTTVSTSEQLLPCKFLFDFFPQLQKLGHDSTIRGTASLDSGPSGWSFNVQPRKDASTGMAAAEALTIYGVDFANLTWQAGLEVAGAGMLGVYSGTLSDGGLQYVSGYAVVNDGYIGRDTLLGMKNHLGLLLAEAVTEAAGIHEIKFKAAYCNFGIAPGMLELSGYSQQGHSGGVLWDSQNPPRLLAAFPDAFQVPLRELLVVMENSSESRSRQGLSSTARRLVSWLPLSGEVMEGQSLRLSQAKQ